MTSPRHHEVLDLLESLPEEINDSLALGTRLRADHSPEIVAAALTQHELRRAARAKFGERAAHMLFTRDGLEQASRQSIATYHASVFSDHGITSLREVGPGIGGDTLAFGEAGIHVDARDLDPERIEIAAHNLADYPHVRLSVGDGLADIDTEGLWADPARRGARGRISHPDQWSPPLSAVLEAAKSVQLAGIKVAPGISYSDLPPDARVDWIGEGPDLLEAVIWVGDVAPGRSAVLVGGPTAVFDGDPSVEPAQVDPRPLGRYLYDPHPAFIRAGGLASVCVGGCGPVAPRVGYLTSDELIDSPWLTPFEIDEVVQMKPKAINTALTQRTTGTVDIKKRGVDITPENLRTKLKLNGDASITLVLSPTLEGRRAILARRVER